MTGWLRARRLLPAALVMALVTVLLAGPLGALPLPDLGQQFGVDFSVPIRLVGVVFVAGLVTMGAPGVLDRLDRSASAHVA